MAQEGYRSLPHMLGNQARRHALHKLAGTQRGTGADPERLRARETSPHIRLKVAYVRGGRTRSWTTLPRPRLFFAPDITKMGLVKTIDFKAVALQSVKADVAYPNQAGLLHEGYVVKQAQTTQYGRKYVAVAQIVDLAADILAKYVAQHGNVGDQKEKQKPPLIPPLSGVC